jgi:putative phosphoribosyl transferase
MDTGDGRGAGIFGPDQDREAHERDEEVTIVGAASIKGNLAVPRDACGIVIFAHGSGSGRFSPRNRFVAAQLNAKGIATLLVDLLTEREEEVDEITRQHRFDISLLASRLMQATDYCAREERLSRLGVGYFGASTGAAAALIAAAQNPGAVQALVSRGGRPDLAGKALGQVRAPTLLVVGSLDHVVIGLNQQALQLLANAKAREMVLVRGATHLFEEPGALEQVAELAARWFGQYLSNVA